MFSIKELVDGMECFFRFTHHAQGRMVERMIGYDEVMEDCKLVGEELLSLKEGAEVNIVNVSGNRISCVALNTDDDYNLFIDVKTVIDEGQVKKDRTNIVVPSKD